MKTNHNQFNPFKPLFLTASIVAVVAITSAFKGNSKTSASGNETQGVTEIAVTPQQYTELTTAYTGTTKGGKISKSAMQAVLNAMAPTDTHVKFRFCIEGQGPESKTSVIFVGGNTMYRNTGDGFCPVNCD
jgi:hypothetical protein